MNNLTKTIKMHLNDLHSTDENVRANTCRILAEEGDLSVVDDLRVAATDTSVSVRYFAKKAIASITKRYGQEETPFEIELEQIITLNEDSGEYTLDKRKYRNYLKSSALNKRLAAVDRSLEIAATMGTEWILKTLSEHLANTENPIEQAITIKAIALIGGDEQISILSNYLNHKDHRVRANTVEALEYIGNDKVYPLIVPLLQDKDNRVRANALIALRNYGPRRVLKILKKMVSSQKVWMRDSATYALTKIKSSESVQELLKVLGTETKYNIYFKAIEGLARLGAKKLLDPLKSLKENERDERKILMLDALIKKLNGEEIDFSHMYSIVSPDVIEDDDEPAKDLYRKGIKALARSNIEKARDAFQEILDHHPDSHFARKSEDQLRRIRTKTETEPETSEITEPKEKQLLIDHLIQELENPDEDVRKQAAIKLLNYKSQKAIPALEKASKDSDPVVRYFAQKALRAMHRGDQKGFFSRLQFEPIEISRKHTLVFVCLVFCLIAGGLFTRTNNNPSVSVDKTPTNETTQQPVKLASWQGKIHMVKKNAVVIVQDNGIWLSAEFEGKDLSNFHKDDKVKIKGLVKSLDFTMIYVYGHEIYNVR